MRKVLVPWEPSGASSGQTSNTVPSAIKAESKETRKWMIDWSFAVDVSEGRNDEDEVPGARRVSAGRSG
jgi:hypothetical protein